MGGDRKVHKVLVGKPEGKKPLERPRRRWKYGMKMDVREIDWRYVDCVRLALNKDYCATDSKIRSPSYCSIISQY
jgi:hypothetical protein